MTSARFWRLYHGVAIIAWLVMLPVAFGTGLSSSVPFVSFLSIWALVSTEHSAWQGSRAEVKTEEVSVTAENASVQAGSVTVEEKR